MVCGAMTMANQNDGSAKIKITPAVLGLAITTLVWYVFMMLLFVVVVYRGEIKCGGRIVDIKVNVSMLCRAPSWIMDAVFSIMLIHYFATNAETDETLYHVSIAVLVLDCFAVSIRYITKVRQ